MKNSKKLLAFVIAFAMVMSLMVIPVSASTPAAPTNVLSDMGLNYSFESADGYSLSGATGEIVTPGGTMPAAVDGSSYLKLTSRTNNTGGVQFKNIGLNKSVHLEAGKTYEVSYYVATLPTSEGAATSTKAHVYTSTANETTNIIKVGTTENNYDVDINSNEFTKVSCTVTIASTGLEESGSVKYKGIHIGTWTAGTYDVYIDNFSVKEIPPAMTVEVSGVEDGAEVEGTSATLTYTFSNAPYEFAPANVVVTPSGADVAITGSGTVYTVALSNLAKGTDYTVSLTNVQDMYAQLVTVTRSFSTAEAVLPSAPQNLLPGMTGVNYSFEGADGYTLSGATGEIVTPTSTMPAAIDGSSYLKLTSRTNNTGSVQFKWIGMNGGTQLEAGKTYEVSYYIATLPDGEGNATSTTAHVYTSTANETTNLIKVEATENNDNVAINSDGFTKVSCTVTIASTGLEASSSVKYKGIHIGTWTAGTYDIYIDNFSVKEIPPAMTVEVSGIEDGAEVDGTSATLTYTFSNAPYEFTPANVVVTPSGVDVAVTGSGTVYTVVLSNLAIDTDYIVTLTGVQDMFTQLAESTYAFATADFYLLSADIASGVNPSASTGTLEVNDGVATISKTSAGSARWRVPYALGSRYIITASVKNNDAAPEQGATAKLIAEDYISSRHYYKPTGVYASTTKIEDNEWHKLYEVVVMDEPVQCDCGETCTKNSATAGAYASVNTTSFNKQFSVKDFEVRELKALDIDGTCYAAIVRNGDSATLYIEAPGKTNIYFAAVSFVDGIATDIQFIAADLTEGLPVTSLDIAMGDNYKIMVWDSNLNPLCNTFFGSDI